jgi:hypothetical protein
MPSRHESSDGYSRVVAVLNGKWRVIECRDRIQWILQSRDSLRPEEVGLWRGRSYCRTKETILRVRAAHAGKIAPTTAAVLVALPDCIEPRNLAAAADKACEAWGDASRSQDFPSAGSTTFGALTNGDRTSLKGALPGPLAFPDTS